MCKYFMKTNFNVYKNKCNYTVILKPVLTQTKMRKHQFSQLFMEHIVKTNHSINQRLLAPAC